MVRPPTTLNVLQAAPVYLPLEIVVSHAVSPYDVCHLSLVQKSWKRVAQTELFRNVHIHTILQGRHFVNAFICNLGPENAGKGLDCTPLENFVCNVYLDVTSLIEDQDQSVVILCNFCTITPIFSNLCTLYLKMSRDEQMLRQDLGTFLANTISPSLSNCKLHSPTDPDGLHQESRYTPDTVSGVLMES